MKHLVTLSLLVILNTTMWGQDTQLENPEEAVVVQQKIAISNGDVLEIGWILPLYDVSEQDVLVVRRDNNHNVVWKKIFESSGQDDGTSIATTSDNGIVITGSVRDPCCSFKGEPKGEGGKDIFVIKLDMDGKVLWENILGGSNDDEGRFIGTDTTGEILVTGVTESNDGDFEGMSKGGSDIFVIKLNEHGKILWKRTLGGSRDDYTEYPSGTLVTRSDGEILITGSTISNDGDFVGMNRGGKDVFVVKIDNHGNLLWTRVFGGTSDESGDWVSTTFDNGFLVSGLTNSTDGHFKTMNKGGWDIFVTNIDNSGHVLWNRLIGGTADEYLGSLSTNLDGDIVISGHSKSKNGDFKGVKMKKGKFIMKLDKDGNIHPPKK